jgi:hypothetical protein
MRAPHTLTIMLRTYMLYVACRLRGNRGSSEPPLQPVKATPGKDDADSGSNHWQGREPTPSIQVRARTHTLKHTNTHTHTHTRTKRSFTLSRTHPHALILIWAGGQEADASVRNDQDA